MEKIKNRKKHTDQELREIIRKAQRIAEEIAKEAARLFTIHEIDGEDLHKILLANEELFIYLNSRYVNDERLNEEVLTMTRTLYDSVVAEKAKQEGKLEGRLEGRQEGRLEAARNALIKGFSLEDIAEITGLPMETLRKLKAELTN